MFSSSGMTDAILIEATSLRLKTLVDGEMRIELSVQPGHEEQAFKILGKPGKTVVIAPLTAKAAKKSLQAKAAKGPYGTEAQQLYQYFLHGTQVLKALSVDTSLTGNDARNAAKEALKNQLGYDSLAEIPPNEIYDWAFSKSLCWSLPDCYKGQ